MPTSIPDRVTTPVLLALLVLAGVAAAWLAIVLFGAVTVASMKGEVSQTAVVASGSALACALWSAARDIVKLGFRVQKENLRAE
jgi:hypothetical protein